MDRFLIMAAIGLAALGVYSLTALAAWWIILHHSDATRLKRVLLAAGIVCAVFVFLVQLIRQLFYLGETSWIQVMVSPLVVAVIFAINHGLIVVLEKHARTKRSPPTHADRT